jgi:hypothetical protein
VGFVLTKFYKVERVRAVDALIDLLNRAGEHRDPRDSEGTCHRGPSAQPAKRAGQLCGCAPLGDCSVCFTCPGLDL